MKRGNTAFTLPRGEAQVPATVISMKDLIKNKLAAGRLRDLADVEALEAAEAARQQS